MRDRLSEDGYVSRKSSEQLITERSLTQVAVWGAGLLSTKLNLMFMLVVTVCLYIVVMMRMIWAVAVAAS